MEQNIGFLMNCKHNVVRVVYEGESEFTKPNGKQKFEISVEPIGNCSYKRKQTS